MDDIVRQAMAKWPNVPDCFGWLALDARGDWYLRDDFAQAAGPFAAAEFSAQPLAPSEPARRVVAKGSRLLHDKLVNFIARNYQADAIGQWFFQNGPQRVYVELEATPLVWRVALAPQFELTSHTGIMALAQAAFLDEQGCLYLLTDLGFGLVHSLDMTHAADAIEGGHWQPEDVLAAQLPARFGFVRSPQRAHQSTHKKTGQ